MKCTHPGSLGLEKEFVICFALFGGNSENYLKNHCESTLVCVTIQHQYSAKWSWSQAQATLAKLKNRLFYILFPAVLNFLKSTSDHSNKYFM